MDLFTNNIPTVQEQNIFIEPASEKIKILFYHAGNIQWGIWIATASLTFKTYIDLRYPDLAARLEWLVPIQTRMNDDEIIDYIDQTGADILCTGHYVWNHEFLVNQLSNIKKKLPNHLKIIAGGPSININIDPDFFKKHPYIDYAVYGTGEQAFTDILNHLVLNKPLIAVTTSNCGWKNVQTGETIVADYKFVKLIETSPFIHNKELFSKMIKQLAMNTYLKNRKEHPSRMISLPYTVTRGCPYSCTYCDWNSGFDNKVSRRKNTYKQEIDLFQSLKIKNILLADANFGQYNEDLDIIEYFALKNTQENAGFIITTGNFSKLKKENNMKIFHIMINSKLAPHSLSFSIQDTNDNVLKNINRPDVGWEVHAAMADELRQTHPHMEIRAQLIYGLPGQTAVSWRETLKQITSKNILPEIYINEPLPASPAMYDPEYQRNFQFEYVMSHKVTWDNEYNSLVPKKCISFDQRQLVDMAVLSSAYTGLVLIKIFVARILKTSLDIEPIVDDFLTQDWYKNLHDNLYQNWTTQQNFFFTVEDKKIGDPFNFGFFMVRNYKFLTYIIDSLPNELRDKFLQPETKSELYKFIDDIAKVT